MKDITRFFASKSTYREHIDLWAVGQREDSTGRRAVWRSVILEMVDPSIEHVAFASISTTEAQILMDALWDCGVRPTAGAGSAGAMAAVSAHLEDMRALAFAKSGVEKPVV